MLNQQPNTKIILCLGRYFLQSQYNLSEVREHTQVWMDEYNNRPHEGLGNLTPTELSKNIRHKQQINQLVT
ncbi:integrase core domain-containing protein [Sphingobacterium multivorum]|uniref:integrase core domain-containing protein n=1 Tax=Sphingobacterium multivorum TaxID=28454 RepID=UPI0037445396